MKYHYTLSSILVGASIVLVQPQVTIALSPSEVTKVGAEITVRILTDVNDPYAKTGSGVIVKRSGNTYTVLTARHVVPENKTYQILASDQQSYSARKIEDIQGIDLAILEFNSSKNYTVAKIGNSDKATYTTTTYVAGFPAKNSTSNDSPARRV
jgi:S1-C subfamily serine protease